MSAPKKPQRGGWNGGPVKKTNYRFAAWCLAIGFIAVAVAVYVIAKS